MDTRVLTDCHIRILVLIISTFTESHKTGKQRHCVTEQQRKTVTYKQKSIYLISGVLLQYKDLDM